MKNIHVLPTDKASRIFKSQDNDFILLNTNVPNWFEINLNTTKQNIYITNDEEIKEGDWFYNKISLKHEPFKACQNGDEYVSCSRYSHYRIDCKKIILTTDQDLIKDGVQAIDDDFLEWFVKNPSCEEVEVEINSYMDKNISDSITFTDYKIIIPKEEAKKKHIVMLVGDKVNEEQTKCYCGHTTYCDCGPEEPKQETLEESLTAEEFFRNKIKENIEWEGEITLWKVPLNAELSMRWTKEYSDYVIKWQQQQMYSEEELKSAFKIGFNIGYGSPVSELDLKNEYCEKWFEQFKNK